MTESVPGALSPGDASGGADLADCLDVERVVWGSGYMRPGVTGLRSADSVTWGSKVQALGCF
jgi:hypothetical protein